MILLIFLVLLSFTSKAVAQDPRLIDAAKKEGGKVVIYGSPETPVVDAVIQAFQKKTGLGADYWRASAMSVMNRAMSEYRAGNALYDVVLNNTDPLYIMAKEGMVAKYDSPRPQRNTQTIRLTHTLARSAGSVSSASFTTRT